MFREATKADTRLTHGRLTGRAGTTHRAPSGIFLPAFFSKGRKILHMYTTASKLTFMVWKNVSRGIRSSMAPLAMPALLTRPYSPAGRNGNVPSMAVPRSLRCFQNRQHRGRPWRNSSTPKRPAIRHGRCADLLGCHAHTCIPANPLNLNISIPDGLEIRHIKHKSVHIAGAVLEKPCRALLGQTVCNHCTCRGLS